MKNKKICFIVQRYGCEVTGGAEAHARILAESLVHERGLDVTVYTSTALDYRDWKHHYPSFNPSKPEILNGVKIQRFKPWIQRSPFLGFFTKVLRTKRLKYPRWLRSCLEAIWFTLQGPFCPELLFALKKNRDAFDQFIFVTYLYFPTVFGLSKVKEKSILIPTAHDEDPFYFQFVKKILQDAPKIFANTSSEIKLIQRIIPDTNKMEIAGLWIDEEFFHFRSESSKEDYVLYLGRVSHGKGVFQLAEYFARWQCSPKPKLYLAGMCEDDFILPNELEKDIVMLGFLSDAEKIKVMAGAKAIINPSPLESLSLITLEAMALQRPVLVNGHCDVLNEYSKQTESVFSYKNELEFRQKLDAILGTNWQSTHNKNLLLESQEYVSKHYSKQRILDLF